MNKENIYEIIKYLGTKRRASVFCERIEIILRESEGIAMDSAIVSELTSEEIEMISKLYTDKSELRASLLQLASEIRKTESMRILVARRPSWLYQQKLLKTLQNAIKEQFFIEIEERTTLIAGAIIEFKGKRKDFSLKSKLGTIT